MDSHRAMAQLAQNHGTTKSRLTMLCMIYALPVGILFFVIVIKQSKNRILDFWMALIASLLLLSVHDMLDRTLSELSWPKWGSWEP